MSRLKFWVIIAILGVPLLLNYYSTVSPGGFSDITQPGQGAGVIQSESADIDGDGDLEEVRLVRDPGDFLTVQNLRLQVVDAGKVVTTPIPSQGYVAATLNLIEMNGHEEQEIFVTLVASGANGLQQLYGYRFKDGAEHLLFSPVHHLESTRFDLTLTEDRKVLFKDLTTGFTGTLDLADHSEYADFTKQELERFYNSQKEWKVEPYSGFSWADLNGNGVKEIVGSRSITGLTRADRIGTLQEYYRLEGEVYKPYAQALFSTGGVEMAGQIISQNEGGKT